MPALLVAWMGACIALAAGWSPTIAAAINLACCYYFFIAMRWRGVLRGLGAPGFMATWLAAAVLLIELTRRHIPELQALAIFVLQIDFALIMLAGRRLQAPGRLSSWRRMELGMVNPQWGYWGRTWAQVSPTHPCFASSTRWRGAPRSWRAC
jgi:peptidoglycan biosynthesis protein MviN/MurJ (putative lipid II flippase)